MEVMQEIGQVGAKPPRRSGKLPVLIWRKSPDGAGEERWISAERPGVQEVEQQHRQARSRARGGGIGRGRGAGNGARRGRTEVAFPTTAAARAEPVPACTGPYRDVPGRPRVAQIIRDRQTVLRKGTGHAWRKHEQLGDLRSMFGEFTERFFVKPKIVPIPMKELKLLDLQCQLYFSRLIRCIMFDEQGHGG